LQSAIDREDLTELLIGLDVSPEVRAEDLSLEQWIKLANLVAVATAIED
jgi:16S rRNA (adenine1518-N6/adenine1519-N6)-dimethyltransferase